MRPRLVSCVFGPEPYPRLARVLDYSARVHCAGWDVQLLRTPPATCDPRDGTPLSSALGKTSHVTNTQKMLVWAAVVETAPDDTPILLIDCDTFITRPLDDIWAQPFDFAYTTKPDSRFPFNSGVVFVRATDRTRQFFRRWRDENLMMLRDRDHHQAWRARYGGINQAALGRALEAGWTSDLVRLELPCQEWNCEDAHWRTFDPAVTRIVHVKSALRLAVLGYGPVLPSLRPLVHAWQVLESRA